MTSCMRPSRVFDSPPTLVIFIFSLLPQRIPATDLWDDDRACADRHAQHFSLLLFHERPIPVRGAEIDIDAFDLVAFEGEELGIPEILSTFGQAFVGHKGLIAFDKDLFEFMPFDPVGVAPATYEIGGLVDLVVIL